jgi:hypothetical protein
LVEQRIRRMEDRLAAIMVQAEIDVGVILHLMYARMNV